MASAARTKVRQLVDEDKYAEAARIANSSLDGFRDADDKLGQATMLLAVAEVNLAQKQSSKTLKYAREAYGLSKSLGDKTLAANILVVMINGLNMEGQAKSAIKAANTSMAIVMDSQDRSMEAGLHVAMSTARLKLQDLDDAVDDAQSALEIYKELKDKQGEASALSNIAKAQFLLGRFDNALSNANEAAAIWRGAGKGEGLAASVDTIVNVQLAQGISASMALNTAEEELIKLKKAGCNTHNELVLMEKISQLALDNGLRLDSCRIMEDMITVCQTAGDKPLEAQKTMRAAEVHAQMNHSQDALRLATAAEELFEELGMTTEVEEAKKMQTDQCVKMGDYSKAPHRDGAVLALKSFIQAVEQREIEQMKDCEVDLNKFAAAIKDAEMSSYLQALFERDPSAIGFLEQHGWDLAGFKSPTQVYQYPHKAFYLTQLAGGMGFGPQFRAVYPWRKGKEANNDVACLSSCFLPETEAWQGQLMFRFGLMDAGLQTMAVRAFPPY